jgi:hypothetical protein
MSCESIFLIRGTFAFFLDATVIRLGFGAQYFSDIGLTV